MALGSDKFVELPRTVNELIADRAIRHALYLERYKSQLVHEIMQHFNDQLEPELLAKIERSLRKVSKTSQPLQSLFKENGVLVRDEYRVMQAKLYEQLQDFSEVESSWLIKTMRVQAPIAWNFIAPSPATLKAVVTKQPLEGALVKDWFSKLAADTAFQVNRAIQVGMVEGEGIADIVRRIRGTRAAKYTDGVLNAPRSHIESVVRTSVATVSHNAREETYQANTDIISGVQIIATLDTRTCIECMNLDGKVYPVGEGQRPAFHFSCRCSDAPVLKSWKELGIPAKEADATTRASMNGQVPETTTYAEWLKKQTPEIQQDALGVTRAKLFNSGKVKIKEFTNDRGQTLTLKELAQKSDIARPPTLT